MENKESLQKNQPIPLDFAQLEGRLRDMFADSVDIVFRKFLLGGHKQQALLVFVDGLASKTVINENIMRPLLWAEDYFTTPKTVEEIADAVLEAGDLKIRDQFHDMINAILGGETALFVQGSKNALTVETRQWEKTRHQRTGQRGSGPRSAGRIH